MTKLVLDIPARLHHGTLSYRVRIIGDAGGLYRVRAVDDIPRLPGLQCLRAGQTARVLHSMVAPEEQPSLW